MIDLSSSYVLYIGSHSILCLRNRHYLNTSIESLLSNMACFLPFDWLDEWHLDKRVGCCTTPRSDYVETIKSFSIGKRTVWQSHYDSLIGWGCLSREKGEKVDIHPLCMNGHELMTIGDILIPVGIRGCLFQGRCSSVYHWMVWLFEHKDMYWCHCILFASPWYHCALICADIIWSWYPVEVVNKWPYSAVFTDEYFFNIFLYTFIFLWDILKEQF